MTAYTSKSIHSKSTERKLAQVDHILCKCPESHNYELAGQPNFGDVDLDSEMVDVSYVCSAVSFSITQIKPFQSLQNAFRSFMDHLTFPASFRRKYHFRSNLIAIGFPLKDTLPLPILFSLPRTWMECRSCWQCFERDFLYHLRLYYLYMIRPNTIKPYFKVKIPVSFLWVRKFLFLRRISYSWSSLIENIKECITFLTLYSFHLATVETFANSLARPLPATWWTGSATVHLIYDVQHLTKLELRSQYPWDLVWSTLFVVSAR